VTRSQSFGAPCLRFRLAPPLVVALHDQTGIGSRWLSRSTNEREIGETRQPRRPVSVSRKDLHFTSSDVVQAASRRL
jgi:hypothetical protein